MIQAAYSETAAPPRCGKAERQQAAGAEIVQAYVIDAIYLSDN